MIEKPALRETIDEIHLRTTPSAVINKRAIFNQSSRIIDPLAYSLDFEQALFPQITLLQSTLDYVALQLQSTHQRRLLTRLEHNMFATASLAFEQGASFGLDLKQKSELASDFLIKAMRSALQMVIPTDGRSSNIEHILKRLCTSYSDSKLSCELSTKQYLTWDNSQNLSDLLDLNSNHGLKLQTGNQARKLHYLCQLSVFTSTPKKPDEYPLSVLVSAEEYFSLSTMWARKPALYTRNALITESGKLIICKVHDDSEIIFRKDLGLVADLHLQLAKLIQKSASS